MILIQESKLEAVDRITLLRLWGNGEMEFACSNAIGASGGLITIWNKSFFRAENIVVHRHFILVQGSVNNNFPCVIVNVYAPNDTVSRRGVWEELVTLKAISQLPWCLGGDFNEIMFVNERIGCSSVDRGMRDFVDFGNNLEVVDIPMLGRKFTWTNYQNHAIHSRLDRFLVSQEWLERYQFLQWALPRPISDHCPIMLLDDNRDWGPKPFRFMDMWMSDPKCMKIAKETWDGVQTNGWAGFTIMQKMKAIKVRLRVWNKEEFGDINVALSKVEDKIHQFDLLAEDRQLVEEEKAQRCLAKTEFWRL